MEQVGAQLVTPFVIHHTLPIPIPEACSMDKKRDLCPNPHQQYHQNSKTVWNPKVWSWDSVGFVAKPSEPEILRIDATRTTGQEKKLYVSTLNGPPDDGVEDERLRLKLGDRLSPPEQAVSRPTKRVRSGSPGPHSYPMCQVDRCIEDLSNSKDYHRRHKVCEVHSKSTKALVANQLQRFCQQCSRFHPLFEFDDGKRSCRRRLAGHNRRRRKIQPGDVTSKLSHPQSQDSSCNGNLDVVKLLAAIAHTPGSSELSSMPDKEQLVQILGKIKSLPLPADFMTKLKKLESLGQNESELGFAEQQSRRLNDNNTPSSSVDPLPVISTTPLAAHTPISQSCQSIDSENTKVNSTNHALDICSVPVLDSQVQRVDGNLPLQLFSSSPEGDSPPKLASQVKCFSDCTNPVDDRSASASPIVQRFSPMQTIMNVDGVDHAKVSVSREATENIEANQMHHKIFKKPHRKFYDHSYQSYQQQTMNKSSSVSDHSPSDLNSDAQNRTGRIIFKLFDKDPSHFPGPLRVRIYKWLSHSPSEMESYIRPGCVVLSIYVSMPSAAWKELEENLLARVHCLVDDSEFDFWRNGRFLVHTEKQLAPHRKLASHNDGKIGFCKFRRSLKMPELISVSPLAVVSGQETSLVLKGRNLTCPGTTIHCTYMGGYVSKDVSGLAYEEGRCCSHDMINFGSIKFPAAAAAASSVSGRCFLEVENGWKGNSFPVIIADATVCEELRLLECVFDGEATSRREEALHFLNELGWLFQRGRRFSVKGTEEYDRMIGRFRFLVIFCIERDWCGVMKTLLDVYLGDGFIVSTSMESVRDMELLNRAVRRRCGGMVRLLVNYGARVMSRSKYIFPPNEPAGPNGFTPLHLVAAAEPGLDDIVDALTSDPHQIGLRCWDSVADAWGVTSYGYAVMRSNESYNRLVACKLGMREACVVGMEAGSGGLRPNYNSCALRLRHRPHMGFMVGVACVCACVCMFCRSMGHGFVLESVGHCTI